MIKRRYCSITVANYDGTWLIIFISKSYIHPQKFFVNTFYLVLHECICLFWKKFHAPIQTRRLLQCFACPPNGSVGLVIQRLATTLAPNSRGTGDLPRSDDLHAPSSMIHDASAGGRKARAPARLLQSWRREGEYTLIPSRTYCSAIAWLVC